jgi:hypothetical protein
LVLWVREGLREVQAAEEAVRGPRKMTGYVRGLFRLTMLQLAEVQAAVGMQRVGVQQLALVQE